jgi:hypothetical protein
VQPDAKKVKSAPLLKYVREEHNTTETSLELSFITRESLDMQTLRKLP